MDTHVYNEQKKRLEPQNTLCVFCGQNHITNGENNCYLNIYKEKSRTNVLVYRNVKFAKITIGAPRCSSCKLIHTQVKIKSILYSICAFLIGMLPIIFVSYILFRYITIFAIFLGVFLFIANLFLTIYITYYYFENRFIKKYNILTPRQGLQEYPFVQDLLNDGFTFEQPLA